VGTGAGEALGDGDAAGEPLGPADGDGLGAADADADAVGEAVGVSPLVSPVGLSVPGAELPAVNV
jgi:hypothetical protein